MNAVKDEADKLMNDEQNSLQGWFDDDEFNTKAACLFVIPQSDLDVITQLVPDVGFILLIHLSVWLFDHVFIVLEWWYVQLIVKNRIKISDQMLDNLLPSPSKLLSVSIPQTIAVVIQLTVIIFSTWTIYYIHYLDYIS